MTTFPTVLGPTRPVLARWGPALAVLTLASGLSVISAVFARGWLVAYVIWSGIPVGSLVLLLIHRLVGGRWGVALAPLLRRAAGRLPVAALAFLPVALGSRHLFPWAASPSSAEPSTALLYLNLPFFLLRAAVALGGWSALALLVARNRMTVLGAGLGLAFYGLSISVVAVDWILSVDPRFVSSAFAAGIAVQQILSALAWAALRGPASSDSPARSDLGAFLMAALLGVVYLGFMAYLVSWYGDLPDKAAWYLERVDGGWGWTIMGALAVGGLLPVGILLKQDLRQDPFALRVVGGLILVGVALHLAWLLVPAFGSATLAAALVCLAALGSLSVALGRLPLEQGPVAPRVVENSHER